MEVHDAEELARAKALEAPLIGVNNRDLKTFAVDLDTTGKFAAELIYLRPCWWPSGIPARADVEQLQASGARAILVGESLMRQENIAAKVRELSGQTEQGGGHE